VYDSPILGYLLFARVSFVDSPMLEISRDAPKISCYNHILYLSLFSHFISIIHDFRTSWQLLSAPKRSYI